MCLQGFDLRVRTIYSTIMTDVTRNFISSDLRLPDRTYGVYFN